MRFWNKQVLSNEAKVFCSRTQWEPWWGSSSGLTDYKSGAIATVSCCTISI